MPLQIRKLHISVTKARIQSRIQASGKPISPEDRAGYKFTDNNARLTAHLTAQLQKTRSEIIAKAASFKKQRMLEESTKDVIDGDNELTTDEVVIS